MKSTSHMFLVVHVPKTAGTSLRHAFELHYGADKVIRDYGPNAAATSDVVREYLYSGNGSDKKALVQKASEGGAKALIGHFPIQKYANYFSPDRVIAFVREPLERACSEYLHRTYNKTYDGAFCDFAQSNALKNIQTRFLKGVSDQSFIGLTEKYPESLRYINKRYNLKLRNLKRNMEKKGGGAEFLEKLTDSQKSVFYKHNENDLKLYKHLRGRFTTLTIPPSRLELITGLLKTFGPSRWIR